jgi:hypothetical protein
MPARSGDDADPSKFRAVILSYKASPAPAVTLVKQNLDDDRLTGCLQPRGLDSISAFAR